MLQVDLVQTEHAVPKRAEGVPADLEGRIRAGVPERTQKDGGEAGPRPAAGELPAQEQVVSDRYAHGSREAEHHEGLDVGVLEGLHVEEDGRDEDERHGEETDGLIPLQPIALDVTNGLGRLDHEGRTSELGEQDEGRGRELVHGVLVADQQGRRAQHVAAHRERSRYRGHAA